ncbi:Probable lipoprotein precursor [Tenacibaculum maritimum]|uniref:DUF4377 domain-containing protein n=1 Tax=Tenacibaculum maritimum TaxID=107401 RepID=UPI0012E5D090|nr:DUF4377 domain-containing protein [Tenacibaculum maritimum]CAA0147980.1 Probable lipoprotein precursor [Tenacibaculum maritimum]CAA0197477.1 Probable lipoprotein precursor [Tenacibaculum maritimum]CAA0241490.1 Probable lipoprotein precursor [Tenacibaculum maritimum]
MKTIPLLLLTAILFVSCDAPKNTLKFTVAPYNFDCTKTTTGCLPVKRENSNAWELYDTIEGFEYEPGFEYLIEVARKENSSPAAYKLIKEVSKIKNDTTVVNAGDFYHSFIGDDGTSLKLFFPENTDDVELIFKGDLIQLTQVPSASGVRYSNNIYELIQWQGETSLRKGETLLFKQTPKVYKGTLVIGFEVSSFTPCGEHKNYWINDQHNELTKQYNELTKEKEPYTEVFAELKLIDTGKAEFGEFPSRYHSTFELIKTNQIRLLTENDCK